MVKPFPKTENIHAIAIPWPGFQDLITVNTYLVGKGPVSLIDTGPKISGSFEFIKDQIKLAGFEIQDIERIIITHGHLDHFGLAASIRDAVGHPVECFIHDEDKWRVSNENVTDLMWGEEFENFMAMAGVPWNRVQKVKKFSAFLEKLGDPIEEISIMDEGDEFAGEGYHVVVIHTPGHTPGSSCLYESQQNILFSGDHIIKHITPNPIMEIGREFLHEHRYKTLKTYLKSLDRLAGLDVRLVFPGHGEYIEDLPGIISSYEIHHQQRMDLVWGALKKKSRPIYHLIEDVFPYVPEDNTFLAISEIMVHLEILIEEGRAALADAGPPALYRAL